MKYFKIFLPATLGLFATVMLHAQELKPVKTEISKPEEIKSPPSPGSDPKPNPDPVTQSRAKPKAENGVKTPSPINKDESKTTGEVAKPVALTLDPDHGTKKLTAEQLKTLNGTAGKPKHLTTTPGANDENANPVIIPKPVIATVKEN